MREELEKYELIDKYLEGNLGEEELYLFEERLSSDEEFASEVQLQQETNAILVDKGLLDLKEKMKTFREKPKGQITNKIWSGVIAVLLISGGIWHFYPENTQPGTPEKENQPVRQNGISKKEEYKKESVKPVQESKEIVSNKKEPVKDKISKESAPGNKKPDSEPEIIIKDSTTEEILVTEKADPAEQPIHPAVAEAEVPKVEKIDCSENKISAFISTEASCENKQEGAIIVNEKSLSGGKAPYVFSIDGGKSYQNSFMFNNLLPGSYSVTIKDANSCVHVLPEEYIIKEKECFESDVAIQPSIGQFWSIPVEPGEDALLIIYNSSGTEVFRSIISSGRPDTWMGTKNNGEELPSGSYLFVLKSDKGKAKKGYISIVR